MTQEFLAHIWPSTGPYCIAVPKVGSTGKYYYEHRVFENIKQVVHYVKTHNPDMIDYYMAVGTLKEKQYHNTKTGKTQTRCHANMGQFKTLLLDIDCGKGKPYANKNEAITALKKFTSTSQAGLPSPTVVSSGGGLHIYFTFEEPVEPDVWYGMAGQLKALAGHFGLAIDNSRTTDKASVLRIVGTFNHKLPNNPREVKVLRFGEPTPVNILQSKLSRAAKDFKLKVDKPRPAFDKMPEGLLKHFENVRCNTSNVDGKFIRERCNMMGQIHACGGDIGFQAWRGSLLLDRHCDEPVPYELSTGSGSFNEQIMLGMIEDARSRNVGPTTCRYFRDINEGPEANWCDGCTYNITSPISLGTTTKAKSPPKAALEDTKTEINASVTLAPIPPPTTPSTGTGWEGDEDDLGDPESLEDASEIDDDEDEDGEREDVYTLETDHGKGDLPDPPEPYKRSEQGILFEMAGAEEGEVISEVIYEYDIFPYRLMSEGERGIFHVGIRVIPPHSEPKDFDIPLNAITDSRLLAKLFADQAVVPRLEAQSGQLMTYMRSYICELYNKMKPVTSHHQLGWLDDRKGFVFPEGTMQLDGTIEKSGMATGVQEVTKHVKKRGNIEDWKKVINTYSLPQYEPHAFGHLTGYGSILLNFTEYSGAIVNMLGKSGSGKSTVLKTINTLFGHPEDLMVMQQDKYLAKIGQIGIYNSICATYDEITNIDEEELSDFCYTITQGRGRHRLNQNAELKENNTRWKLIVASTSNASLLGKLSLQKHDATAESMRVFEYRVDPLSILTKEQAQDIFDEKLFDNYGHAGEIFVNYVIQHQEEIRDQIRAMTLKFDRAANVVNRERYWSAVIACSLVGGTIAKELGLNNFDIDKIFKWCITQVNMMRGTVEENYTTPTELIVNYLNSHLSNTLHIPPEENGRIWFQPHMLPKNQLLIRNEEDGGKAYIDRKALGKWLKESGADFSQVKRELLASRVLLSINTSKVLGAGCKDLPKTGQTKCWLIDLNHKDIAGLVLISEADCIGRLPQQNVVDLGAIDKSTVNK